MDWRDLIMWNRKKQQQMEPELRHPVAATQREGDRLFDALRKFDRYPSLPFGNEKYSTEEYDH